MRLTLQTCLDGQWHRAGTLDLREPGRGSAGACDFEYDFDYLARWIGADAPNAAVSLRLPVMFGPFTRSRWPTFLDDIRPMGSARRWWMRRLDLHDEPASDAELLRRGTLAPVGNLRIEEAVPPRDERPPRKFARQEVIEREHFFLEHAADMGAHVGGATGAGGESPKLLVRKDASDQVWIDVWQDAPAVLDAHYLVKFARGQTDRDRLILRSEYVYYRALAALGVETIPVEGMSLEEGAGGPSLWLPRFDIARQESRLLRWGLESVYALVESAPGAFLTHQRVLEVLREVLRPALWQEVLLEYLRRDVLNLVFGNSDNHGRNTAVLKTESVVKLAPVYDFAPMKMDPEGVTRTTRWEGFERGGEVDYPALLEHLASEYGTTTGAYVREGLRELAVRLQHLPDLLITLGLPEETLNFPALGLRHTERKLRQWTLL